MHAPIPWHDWYRIFHHWNEAYQWPLFVLIGWLAIYIRRWRRNRAEEAALGWPSVIGTVLGGKVSQLAHTSRHLATLEYSYFLTEPHSGRYTQEFSKKAEAEEFVRQMKDKQLPIRYNPSDPNKSVLERRTIEQCFALAPRFT